MTSTTQVQLKAFKEAGGAETLRFEAVLYLDGKKAGVVSNGGEGGGHCYHFLDKDSKQQFDQIVAELQTAELKKAVRLHHHLSNFLTEMRRSFPDYAQTQLDRDSVIDALITDLIEQKEFKKWVKKGRTVFRLPSDPVGEYRSISIPYTPSVKARLIQEHGDIEIEIVNELIRA